MGLRKMCLVFLGKVYTHTLQNCFTFMVYMNISIVYMSLCHIHMLQHHRFHSSFSLLVTLFSEYMKLGFHYSVFICLIDSLVCNQSFLVSAIFPTWTPSFPSLGSDSPFQLIPSFHVIECFLYSQASHFFVSLWADFISCPALALTNCASLLQCTDTFLPLLWLLISHLGTVFPLLSPTSWLQACWEEKDPTF